MTWRRRYWLVAAAIAVAVGCSQVQDPHPDEDPPDVRCGDLENEEQCG